MDRRDQVTTALETVREALNDYENHLDLYDKRAALAALSTIEAELERLRRDLDAVKDEWGDTATPYERDYLRVMAERDEAVAALREAMKYVALMPRADYDRLARLSTPKEQDD